jgi:cytochrome bd ubiquinol oxidase subunit I
MNTVVLARAQMGLSLAFHIVFAALGVGLPLLLVLAEWKARKTGNAHYEVLAKRMAKGTAVLFAVGAVSGTVLSMELGLLWPELMRRFGEVIGPMFALEGFAFFTEAIFIGIYLYGRGKVSPRVHFASACIVAISGAASAAFVTVVNAFMNEPVPVLWDGDRAYLAAPMEILRSPSAPWQIVHVLLSSYAVSAFAMCGVHAALWLRGTERTFHVHALSIALPVACAMGLPLPISGDLSAKHVAGHQTWKLGAMEAHFESGACAPLRVGGIPDETTHEVPYALNLPCGLSLLTQHDPHATVEGLDRIPRNEWPRVMRTHFAFQSMVGCGSIMALISVGMIIFRVRKKAFPETPFAMRLLVFAAPLPVVAMESGWLVTEWGRQPFVVRGMLRTADAATSIAHLEPRFAAFCAIYIFLAITVIYLLRGLFLAAPEIGQHP